MITKNLLKLNSCLSHTLFFFLQTANKNNLHFCFQNVIYIILASGVKKKSACLFTLKQEQLQSNSIKSIKKGNSFESSVPHRAKHFKIRCRFSHFPGTNVSYRFLNQGGSRLTCKHSRIISISGERKPLWISEKQTYLSSVCHSKTRKYTLTSFC